MAIWKGDNWIQPIASLIWNLSESTKIPLGKYAPKIFNLMMGGKSKKIK